MRGRCGWFCPVANPRGVAFVFDDRIIEWRLPCRMMTSIVAMSHVNNLRGGWEKVRRSLEVAYSVRWPAQ